MNSNPKTVFYTDWRERERDSSCMLAFYAQSTSAVISGQETDRQTDRPTETQRDRHRHRERQRQSERENNPRQTDRDTERQRQSERENNPRQTDKDRDMHTPIFPSSSSRMSGRSLESVGGKMAACPSINWFKVMAKEVKQKYWKRQPQ